MSDNFHFDIAFRGDEQLKAALRIALWCNSGASGYRIAEVDGKPMLLLYWSEPSTGIEDYLPFPFRAGLDFLSVFCADWLANQPDSQCTQFLDHDGDSHRGWRVWNEAWGHVLGDRYAFCGVQPVWMWYGK